MRRFFIFFIFLIVSGSVFSQDSAFQSGEHYKFRIHYGIFNAGYATLDLRMDVFQGNKLFHAVGKGWTTGVSRWFMSVNDLYESYFDEYNRPHRFIRKIDEGGYTMDKELRFNQTNHKVLVINKKKNTAKNYPIPAGVHDMVSVFYYLRNYDMSSLSPGSAISVNMFFDEEVYPFKLKYLGKDVLKTKFGKIRSLKFRPLVQKGRVFKENESLTIWVSDDQNKIPLLIKAKLLVGSLKADLIEYRNVKYAINFVKD